jgi:RNA polymerase sigma factor for flagellar operon FliA
MNNRPDLVLVASQVASLGRAAVSSVGGQRLRLRLVSIRDSSPPVPPATAGQHSAHEAAFLSNLAVIDSVVRYVCHRHKLGGSEAEDFGSEVKLRLVENDYEVFRRFKQRSRLRTYLTVVIQRIYLDYRNHLWGKWRPSAEAVRLGSLAIRLERLLARDGLRFDEACEALRTNEGVMATESDLAEIAVRLPQRSRRSFVGDDALESVAAMDGGLDDRILSKERQATTRRVLSALSEAVQTLGDQDRLILRLKFQEGLGVADIARALHLEQKPLYRRVDALLQQLRAALEAAGIDRLEAVEIVNREDEDISLALIGKTPDPLGLVPVKGPSVA